MQYNERIPKSNNPEQHRNDEKMGSGKPAGLRGLEVKGSLLESIGDPRRLTTKEHGSTERGRRGHEESFTPNRSRNGDNDFDEDDDEERNTQRGT